MSGAAAPTSPGAIQATRYKDNPLSLCTLKGKPEQEWQPWGHTGPVAPSAAQLELTGLSSQLGFFWLLPVPFQTHSTREKLSGTNQSEHIRASAVYIPLHPTPSSCKEKKSSLVSVRPGAPGTARPSSSRSQASAAHTHLQWGSCPG